MSVLSGAYNGRIAVGEGDMDYVSFGTGPRTLVMLPGLGDGLRTVRGMAVPLAGAYRIFAKQFRVYVFSRRNGLPPGASTRGMAADLRLAMDGLGLDRACVLGVSQGGMIAQFLAIDAPERVERLALAVTLARGNPTVERTVRRWMELAERGDYKTLVADTAEKTYSAAYIRKHHLRLLYPLLGRIGRPASFERFLVQANACLTHDAWEELGSVACPALVIGGGADQIAGGSAAAELAGRIPNSRLLVYQELGHGAYEESKDFNRTVLDFFTQT